MSDEAPRSRPDPLVDEVRTIRRAILEEYDNDLRRLVDHLREIEKQYADRVATPADMRARRFRGSPG